MCSQTCSIGLRSGNCAGYCRSLNPWFLNHSWAFLQVCLGSLSCWYMMSWGDLLQWARLSWSSSKIWMKRSLSILPSILHAYSGPSQSMQPHSITDPPSNFTVPSTSLSLSPSPALFQAHFLPSDPRQLILVLSDHTTLSSPPKSNLCAWLRSPFSPSYAFVTEGAFSSSPLPSSHFSWGVCTLSGEWQVGWW